MGNSEISDYIHRVARGMYLSNVKTMDDHIGLVLDALEETGKMDNTYIIYASDNGGAIDNYQSTGKKRGYKKIPFEGGVHTFATISGPGIPAGAEYNGQFIIFISINRPRCNSCLTFACSQSERSTFVANWLQAKIRQGLHRRRSV